MDRAADYGSAGWGFESLRARQTILQPRGGSRTTSKNPNPTRTGRRPGKPDTRTHILNVAARAFRRDGFTDVSVRGIARDAGVDPALVHRYFGSKRELFLASVQIGLDTALIPATIAAAGPQGLGHRIVATFTGLWESPVGAELIRTIKESPTLMGAMAGYVHDPIVDAATQYFGMSRREAELKAGILEAQIMGLVLARFIYEREPVASLSRQELVSIYGPIFQHILASDLRGEKKSSPPAHP